MKPVLVIVGSGLGGSVLALSLKNDFDIYVIELDDFQANSSSIQGIPYGDGQPSAFFGLGGTTRLWHNGLIEIEDRIFSKSWPYPKAALDPFYAKAWALLADDRRDLIFDQAAKLKSNHLAMDIPHKLLSNVLYYPRKRSNVWKKFDLSNKVSLLRGRVIEICYADNFKEQITNLKVQVGNDTLNVFGDIFVLACGGLGTPLLLQKLKNKHPAESLKFAGCYYEDHPTAYVAAVKIKKPIYRLWNSGKNLSGFLRQPLRVEKDGLEISFQLRPAVELMAKNEVKSILSRLRNNPLNIFLYLKLIFSVSDILDILSIKLGIRFPTKKYSLLMIAEKSSHEKSSIANSNNGAINVNWDLDENYLRTLNDAIRLFIEEIGVIEDYSIYPNFRENLSSSCHHSGTARMASSSKNGVCDENAKVFGFNNLFICDGSVIPASGYANTGLTIAAVALKLSNFLKESFIR